MAVLLSKCFSLLDQAIRPMSGRKTALRITGSREISRFQAKNGGGIATNFQQS
jgi:hypothetical protein